MSESALGEADSDTLGDGLSILHVFADRGAEDPTLARYGDVYRFTLDAYQNDNSQVIQSDAKCLPIQPSVTFDIGVFHPPCTKWSTMPNADSDDSAPNLIPLARDIAQEHTHDWIIENRPNAPLNDPVVLDGHMFNLGIEYERAFETSFAVEQPLKQSKLSETSPFFYPDKSREWWASVKGTSVTFSKEHIAKNTIPSVYIDYLFRHYAVASNSEDAKYENYDKKMDTRRKQTANADLSTFK